MKLGLHVLLLVRVAQLRVRREVEVAHLILASYDENEYQYVVQYSSMSISTSISIRTGIRGRGARGS